MANQKATVNITDSVEGRNMERAEAEKLRCSLGEAERINVRYHRQA